MKPSKKTIVVEYFGKRFPRAVILRAGGKQCFHPERTTLELEEYDALMLLKQNIRINPDKFEFSIAAVIDDSAEDFEAADGQDEKGDDEEGGDISSEGQVQGKKKIKIKNKNKR